jgi:flagellum-specific ATP synthase
VTLLDRDALSRALAQAEALPCSGKVIRAAGLVIEASLPRVPVGTACEILATDGAVVQAEVVGFAGQTARLMPLSDIQGIGEGCEVIPRQTGAAVPVGEALLGRVLDAGLHPIDGGEVPALRGHAPLHAAPPPPLTRRRVSRPLPLGIRSIDAFVTVGEGQRLAVLAGPGVGKSVLLGMLARSASADVVVVALIGERGREVREFIERDLGAGLKRSVVVVATSDEPPLKRLRAAMAATAVAEHFRGAGRRVLLLMDSLSRVAMAQREIGLAAGEPPTTKGYPPSAFALLPRLVERAGNDGGPGSLTAFYTVLAEGDDHHDPVADAAKATLDGHVLLSRKLAESGHFPAVDVLASVSRVMTDIAERRHLELARAGRELLAAYRDSADLVEVGAYAAGSNPRVDRALKVMPALQAFLRQEPTDRTAMPETLSQLARALGTGGAHG